MEETVKVTLASRVAPSIKEKVIQTAAQEGSTTSAYVESILVASFDKDFGTTDTLAHADQTSQQESEAAVPIAIPEQALEVEKSAQDSSSGQVMAEETVHNSDSKLVINDENNQTQEIQPAEDVQLEKEDDIHLINMEFSSEANDRLSLYLEHLRTHYPNQSDDQLILGALFAACCNEIKWGQYIVKSYLTRSEKQRKSLIPFEIQE